MQLIGEQRIRAPRETVWEALNDPEILRRCLPGCQSLAKEASDRFAAVLEIRIGPIGARFSGAVTLTGLDPPRGYTIMGEGKGGMAGHARGSARVRLAEDNGGTLLSYEIDAEVGGRLAQLGGPIIEATAKQLAGKFFSCFEEAITQGGPAPVRAIEAAPVTPSGKPVPHEPAGTGTGAVTPARPAGSEFPWGVVVTAVAALLAGFLIGRSVVDGGWIIAVAVLAVVCVAAGWQAGRQGGRR